MAGIDVRLLSGRATVARAKAAPDGATGYGPRAPGAYRVEVALTVTGKGGSATRRDARSARSPSADAREEIRAALASLAVAVLTTLSVGGATAAPQACANSTPPTILPEPEFTLGVTNVIRWDHVDQSCWDNSGADGKKSAERKFDIVVTNVANGLTEWTSVNGEDETDVTISGSEFPSRAAPGSRVGGSRTRFADQSSSATPAIPRQASASTGGTASALVRDGLATQDGAPPSATLQLGFGSPFTRSLSVPAVVAGSGGSAWMQFATDPALPCGRPGLGTPPVSLPLATGTQSSRARARRRAADVRARLGRRAEAGRRSRPDRLRRPTGERDADLPGHDHRRPDRPAFTLRARRPRSSSAVRRLRDGGAGRRRGRTGQRGQHGPRSVGVRRRSDRGDGPERVARVRRDGDV